MERHITNRMDAVTALRRDRYLYARPDGTFATRDGTTFSREVFEALKSDDSLVLIVADEKAKIDLYKYTADLNEDWGAPHFHEHD